MNKLQQKIKNLPDKPGVYLFKKGHSVIYVGKAKNLKKRVASYFRKNVSHKPEIISYITSLDYIYTTTEKEALLLETNLVKKHNPRFNVMLKGGENFVYIKITKGDFPLINTTRYVAKDGARYFGPYLSAKKAKEVLNTLRKIFPYRICRTLPKKVCLMHHLGYCPAPCAGKIKKTEYQKNIKKIVDFLRGNLNDIIRSLKKEMIYLSTNQHFESAAKTRDKIFSLEDILVRQKIVYPQDVNQDVLSIVREKETAVNVFFIRQGKIIDKKTFILKNTENQSEKEILYSFINQYYSEAGDKPREIIIPKKITNAKILEEIHQLKIKHIQKGKRFDLIKMGRENAQEFLKYRAKVEKESLEKSKKILKELKKILLLKKEPLRIEAYDISNIQGVSPVGSMIVFEKAQAKKSDYRHFAIKTVTGISDTAMMAEILERRLKNKKWPLPNLIIFDGGRGQLNAGLKILKKHKKKIPIISVAKRLEEIYRPDKKKPIRLSSYSPSLYLIQNIRNEAHRFAIEFFRKSHLKKSYRSLLDEIPGLGPKTKKKLLNRFGSVENIKKVDKKELEKVIGQAKTKLIKKYL